LGWAAEHRAAAEPSTTAGLSAQQRVSTESAVKEGGQESADTGAPQQTGSSAEDERRGSSGLSKWVTTPRSRWARPAQNKR